MSQCSQILLMKENIVMDEKLVQNIVMDEELVHNVAMGENS